MKQTCRYRCLAAVIISCLIASRAGADPKFSGVFSRTYENEYSGKSVKSDSCAVCHERDTQTKRLKNNYGDAIAETLRQKNKLDEYAIRQALKDAEEMPSAISGKTFGDLIREGQLPACR